MPIEIATTQNNSTPDMKIDNQVERGYLYKAILTAGTDLNPKINNLRFYKYTTKHNGIETFISEDSNYYIWGYFLTSIGGAWLITKKIGTAPAGSPASPYSSIFKASPGTPDKLFSGPGGLKILIQKINN